MLKLALGTVLRLLACLLSWRFGEGAGRMAEAEAAVWASGTYDLPARPNLLRLLFGPGRRAMVANGLLIFAPLAVGLVGAFGFGCAVPGCPTLIYAYDGISAAVLVWYGMRLAARRDALGLWKRHLHAAIRLIFLAAAVVGSAAAGLFIYVAHTDLASLGVSRSDAALGHSFLIASLLVLAGVGLPVRNTQRGK